MRPAIALISVHGAPALEVGREAAGGQNVYVRNVGEALSKLGWQVDMFTRCISAAQSPIVEHRPYCRTIRLSAGPKTFIPRDELFEYLPNFVACWLEFQTSQGVDYPLVHTNYWLSSWVGMKLRDIQPLVQVHTHHSVGAVKYHNVVDIPAIAVTRLAVEQQCLERADRIIATSPQEKDHLRSLVSRHGKIDIIPCGTDIERFGSVSQAEARAKLQIPLDQKVVLYIGRFDPRKGIETLVRAISLSAFRDSGKLSLIIGGGSRPGFSDGIERDRIEALVRELGIDALTLFPSRISDEDLPLYFAAANVCVIPSHYEPFGLVAIEAMACLTPVVTDVGGLQFTVVPERTGLLVLPQDEKGFSNAINRILADSLWQQASGTTGRKRVISEFSWQGVAQQLSDVYKQLLSTGQKMYHAQ